MRTTLSIHEPLLRRAKELSVQRNMSVGEIVEEALRTVLGSKSKKGSGPIRPLKTYRGDGLQPGVDLSSSAALLEAMDGR